MLTYLHSEVDTLFLYYSLLQLIKMLKEYSLATSPGHKPAPAATLINKPVGTVHLDLQKKREIAIFDGW